MATLAVPPRDPEVAVIPAAATHAQLGDSAVVDASIGAYLGAGDSMAMIMGITGIVCMAIIALIAVAWALGMLPGAVKLFG